MLTHIMPKLLQVVPQIPVVTVSVTAVLENSTLQMGTDPKIITSSSF